jgi:hypothetical protein
MLPASLPACPPARLPACPPARLPACPPARLPAYVKTTLPLDGYIWKFTLQYFWKYIKEIQISLKPDKFWRYFTAVLTMVRYFTHCFLEWKMFPTCSLEQILKELLLKKRSWDSFIHSLVLSLRGRAGRNQSPVMWPVWLWHIASWASSWGSLPLLSPAFRRCHFRRQVPVRPQWRERS